MLFYFRYLGISLAGWIEFGKVNSLLIRIRLVSIPPIVLHQKTVMKDRIPVLKNLCHFLERDWEGELLGPLSLWPAALFTHYRHSPFVEICLNLQLRIFRGRQNIRQGPASHLFLNFRFRPNTFIFCFFILVSFCFFLPFLDTAFLQLSFWATNLY